MKKLVTLLGVAFLALDSFGIGASQAWVLRQLAAFARPSGSTNISVTATIPASAFEGGDCVGDAECTITAVIGTHTALKVVASTVPEIPAGTFYALDDQGRFRNVKNTLLSTIYVTGYDVSRTTTNALGAVSTTTVKMGNFWAVDSTGKAWRMGIDGDTLLYCTDDRSKYIAIRSTTLPDRAAKVLLSGSATAFSVRDMLTLVFPSSYAKTEVKIQYTINSDTTYAIGQITIVRTDRRGNKREVAFTPEGLEGVYKGDNGPFDTYEEAYISAKDYSNWNFGDWEWLWNVEHLGKMDYNDLINSDAWKFLTEAIEQKRVEVLIPAPDMPAHPCPAPEDYWVLDEEKNEWVVNSRYKDQESLDKWRGENDCTCAVVGCKNGGVPQHLEGRCQNVDGELMPNGEGDSGDGCACCVRCVKYASDKMATVREFNKHRANGAGSGYCGCACELFNDENESDWKENYHNYPVRSGGMDYSCVCYCKRGGADSGQFVQHVKAKGDDPWCEKLCGACGKVEDNERYTSFPWPSFDLRQVTLRDPEWSDHTPRSKASVAPYGDSSYFDRCGCACMAYDQNITGKLPKDYASFHQMKDGSCMCHCGQKHTKNKIGDAEQDPYPCPDICVVCKKVEDDEGGTMIFNGEKFKALVMRDPDKEEDHEAHESECGCKCYNDEESKTAWSIGATATDSPALEGGLPKWHKVGSESCDCRCGSISQTATGDYGTLWKVLHIDWSLESECPKICGYCDKLRELGEESEEEDHEPSLEFCGCKCTFVTHETDNPGFHIAPSKTEGECTCACGDFHVAEWVEKSCGPNKWLACSIKPGHIKEGETPNHDFANGFQDDSVHYCRCEMKATASHSKTTSITGRGDGYIQKTESCTTGGCGWSRIYNETCTHGEYGSWHITDNGDHIYMWRACATCQHGENRTIYKDALTGCIKDADYHVPNDDTCGCKCGHYGTKMADDLSLHKWEGEDKCRCKCEGKHKFIAGNKCPNVCNSCKVMDRHGFKADEADHIQASGDVCGCACGYYGVTSEHVASGHTAETARLHKQASGHGDGAPAGCQCYGATGMGGEWHWQYKRSGTCPKICKYTMDGDILGHLAAKSSPEKVVTAATVSDHVAQAYGCGCKCGLCGEETKSYWINETRLHRPLQNAEDQCHCSCDQRKEVGSGAYGHEFKNGYCVCTCGQKHDLGKVGNGCGYCEQCGKIWQNGVSYDDVSNPDRHKFIDGRCECIGGCVIGGNKIYRNGDEHWYDKNKCECVCGLDKVEHLLEGAPEGEAIAYNYCFKCKAPFVTYKIPLRCSRCDWLKAENYGTVGSHLPGCGGQSGSDMENNGCWKCSCLTCFNCKGALHYCNACCPSPNSKRPKWKPSDDKDPEPSPISQYCPHHFVTKEINDTFQCETCSATFHYGGSFAICTICGMIKDKNVNVTGEHTWGFECSGNNGDANVPPPHDCEEKPCGAELANGGSCSTPYCLICTPVCPNASQHKTSHSGDGNSGGGSDGGGDLNDILGPLIIIR